MKKILFVILVVVAASYAANAAVAAPSNGAHTAAQGAATTDIKSLVEQKIKQIPEYYKGVSVDYSIVMPTHVHIILILDNVNTSLPKIINAFKSWVTRDAKRILSAAQGAATTMSNVAAASYAAHDIIIWQPNYYEHIIRNESALNRIREYIMNNPEKEKYDWDRLDA